MNYQDDINRGIYSILNTLINYYLNKKSNKINFEIDISSFEHKWKETLIQNKVSLIKDTRWAGAEWNNSGNKGFGLWGAILSNLKRINVQFNGPDLIPSGEEL